LTDIAIQSVEIAFDDNKSFSKDFSGKSVVVSAVAGATGAGLVSKLGKLGNLAKIGVELTHDATAAAAGQFVAEGKVNGKSVAASALFGKAAGDVAGKAVAKQVAKTPAAKVLAKEANRAGRVAANGPRASRTATANSAVKKAENHVNSRAAAAGTASSGVGGRAAEKILDDEKKKR